MQTQPDKAKAVAHYTHQATLAAALKCAEVVQNSMLHPYIVEVIYRDSAGEPKTVHKVVESNKAPTGHEDVPDDALHILGCSVLPVAHLLDLPVSVRQPYRRDYALWKRWSWTRAGREINVIDLDEQVHRWVHPFGNWAGD